MYLTLREIDDAKDEMEDSYIHTRVIQQLVMAAEKTITDLQTTAIQKMPIQTFAKRSNHILIEDIFSTGCHIVDYLFDYKDDSGIKKETITWNINEMNETYTVYFTDASLMIVDITDGAIFLWSLIVHPDFRNKGLATNLIERLIEDYPNYKIIVDTHSEPLSHLVDKLNLTSFRKD